MEDANVGILGCIRHDCKLSSIFEAVAELGPVSVLVYCSAAAEILIYFALPPLAYTNSPRKT